MSSCSATSDLAKVCPETKMTVNGDFSAKISIPSEGQSFPVNGFCGWTVSNSGEQSVRISITRLGSVNVSATSISR